ncbi:sporulation protein YqfD [Lysinibacillus sp. LZ02]|uniref:sporulation protein YqfD n=1 Tax=Lysinibacillus sp. LZ02 TaxID=3420668 RepID=UPI003D35C05F
MDRRTVLVEVTQGPHVNRLFHLLHKERIIIRNVRFSEHDVTFEIKRSDLPTLRRIRRNTKARLKLRYDKTDAVLQLTTKTLIGMLLLLVIPIICTQFIWRLEVTGATPETGYKAEKFLRDEIGISVPLTKSELPTDYELRQRLMAAFPELSWVHFIKSGGDIRIDLQLAPETEVKTKSEEPMHLIANNSGVITHYFLKSGVRVVDTNMTVYKGDTLVSGVLEAGDRHVVVGAEGEVYADYWFETAFTLNKQVTYYTPVETSWKVVTDQKSYADEIKLPSWMRQYMRIVKEQSYQKHKQVLTEDNLETIILPLLHKKILQSLPPKTTIKAEKILHVTFDDDTVKGEVLFLVNENIATPYPIYQGE